MNNELAGAVWRKSSRSNGQANCVEWAVLEGERVAIRESEDPDQVVITSSANWKAFVEGIQAGDA
jgi:SH3-like domain-containing protein